MRDRELKAYLRTALRQGEEPQAEKKAKTVTSCLEMLRQYGDCLMEERTGFWQFLSSVFRFEGLPIFGVQAGVLFVVCLRLGMVKDIEDIVYSLSAFTPLFALAVMPALFCSRYYNMGELEAATRASGAEILLAKLLLAGAANLICITALLGLSIRLQHSCENIGRLILYGLVPYLVCMTAVLRLLRVQRRERIPAYAAATAVSCVVWGILAKVVPPVYEASATGLWIALLVVFIVFYGREICFVLEKKREGRLYGIIR